MQVQMLRHSDQVSRKLFASTYVQTPSRNAQVDPSIKRCPSIVAPFSEDCLAVWSCVADTNAPVGKCCRSRWHAVRRDWPHCQGKLHQRVSCPRPQSSRGWSATHCHGCLCLASKSQRSPYKAVSTRISMTGTGWLTRTASPSTPGCLPGR
jgi:hypothetical protein